MVMSGSHLSFEPTKGGWYMLSKSWLNKLKEDLNRPESRLETPSSDETSLRHGQEGITKEVRHLPCDMAGHFNLFQSWL